MKQILILTTLLVTLFSCGRKQHADNQSKEGSEVTVNNEDGIQQDNLEIDELVDKMQAFLKDYTYQQVVGKWREPSTVDTLTIHLYSRKYGCEIVTPLFFSDEIDYESLLEYTAKLDPVIYIVNNSNPTDTLKLGEDIGQLYGVYFAINNGDMDGDGLDELMYMINWADLSSLNSFHIASYKENAWVDLFSFPVWEWQFDEGYENVIQKLPEGKIMINFRSDEANEETKIVDLKEISENRFKY